MAGFTGKLLRGDTLVLGQVEGAYSPGPTPRGFGCWGGMLKLVGGSPVVDAGLYTLALDDGSSGEVRVLAAGGGTGRSTVLHFKGSGPPPA
jgi:hypothetical protein